MSRRSRSEKRPRTSDVQFDSQAVTQFINVVLKGGKRSIAQTVVYSALDHLKQKVGGKEDVVQLFRTALDNVRPAVEVRSRRVGGANYQIPVEVPVHRSMALGLRWLVDAAKKRNEKDMSLKLGAELVQAFNNDGNAIRKRSETHRMAEANKAFAHFKY